MNDKPGPAEMEEQDQERDEELDTLQDDLEEELLSGLAELCDLVSDNHTRLANDVQPPVSVISLSAQVAAAVFMAFERGYRMSVEEDLHE